MTLTLGKRKATAPFLLTLLLPTLAACSAGCGSSAGDDDTPEARFPCKGNVYAGTLNVSNASEMARMEGITCLKGNLVVGAPGCRGVPKALPDLSPLRSLEIVTGDVVVQTAKGDIGALSQLVRAGRVQVCNSDAVAVNFPNLVSGDLVIQGSERVVAPKLEHAKVLSIQSEKLTELDLPRLRSASRLLVSASPKFERINLPAAERIDEIALSSLPRFESFLADNLNRVFSLSLKDLASERDRAVTLSFTSKLAALDGRFEVERVSNLKALDVGSLAKVGGAISLQQLPDLESVELGALKSVESLRIENLPKARTIVLGEVDGDLIDLVIKDAPRLSGKLKLGVASLSGSLRVERTQLSALEMSTLKAVRKGVHIEGNEKLTNLDLPKLRSIGGDVVVKDNPKLLAERARALFGDGPRLIQCGQKGGAPCRFDPPRKRYEALPGDPQFIRTRSLKAFASGRADTVASLSVLQHLGKREKKLAKKTPTIFLRSRVSDAMVIGRGRKGGGPVSEWLWLRNVPGRGYTALARGKPKSKEKLSGVRAFVDFDEAYILGEVASKRNKGKVVVYRLSRRTKPASERLGTIDLSRAKSRAILKRGLDGAQVGIRDGDIEVAFYGPDDQGLPLVFRRPHAGRGAFAPFMDLGTALAPGEERGKGVVKDAIAEKSDGLPAAIEQSKEAAKATLGNGCLSAFALPTCPDGTTPSPAGPPKSNLFQCRRENGVIHGPSIQWLRHRCDNKGDLLVVQASGRYDNGRRQGVWTSWRDDGRPREQVTFVDGKRTGLSRQFGDDGRVSAEGILDDGRRVGTWKVLRKGRLRKKKY